jgi:hypothetical protein
MRHPCRIFCLLMLTGLMMEFGSISVGRAQDEKKKVQKYEDVSFLTTEGLRLFGNFYAGNKGRGSDTVLMLPNFKSDLSKGEWNTLAEELQKEGFAVLLFDFRGHGKSKSTKTFDDMKLYNDFATHPWNKLAGVPNGGLSAPKAGIDVKNFKEGIHPYLVNDIAAARKFLDNRNDEGKCNVGKFNIIADRDSCGLAMMWMGAEFKREAIYQRTGVDFVAQNHRGGRDLVSAVFLSYRPGIGGTSNLVNTLVNKEADTALHMREKVSMAFFYGEEDDRSKQQSRIWFNTFGLPATAKDDPRTRKYLIPVAGSKKTEGIALVDPSKGLDTGKQIVSFLKETQVKNLAGTDYILRNANSNVPLMVPLSLYGIKYP